MDLSSAVRTVVYVRDLVRTFKNSKNTLLGSESQAPASQSKKELSDLMDDACEKTSKMHFVRPAAAAELVGYRYVSA